jgi:hypothetical protein
MSSTDDWRVHARLHGPAGFAHALKERLRAADLQHELETRFEDKVAVSVDGTDLFAYTGTREQARAVAKLIGELATDDRPQIELARWHPTAQEWESPDKPLPQSDAEQLAERAERVARERAESATQGYPDYEVRVECESREQAEELASSLAAAGLRSVRRHTYVLLGANDEDSAASLAAQVRGLAPAGATVTVQATGKAIADDLPPNPFAIFGGLGG